MASEFAPSIDIYGSGTVSGIFGRSNPHRRSGLSSNPWETIIDVPQGKEYIYKRMGTATPTTNATVFNERTGHEVEISYVKGKKKLKRIRFKKDEERKLTKDEALESVKNMFKYLKQYNKLQDIKWEEMEMATYDVHSD